MRSANTSKLIRRARRMVELAPGILAHPHRIKMTADGAHPGILEMLDQPWLRRISPQTILDVGANAGQFSYAASKIFPHAQIYAFEPLPGAFEELSERMKASGKFRGFLAAIGDEDGHVVIRQSESSPSSSILPMADQHRESFPWTAGFDEKQVEIRQLDSLLPEMSLVQPVLLKVDVQGYSLQVLKGASECLARTDWVFIETSIVTLYEGESTFDEIYRYLFDAGFEFAGVLDKLEDPETGMALQVDAIFKRSDWGQM